MNPPPSKYLKFILFIFFILIFICNSNSSAQDKTKDSFQLDSYIRYMPSRSIDAASGEVEIVESESEYSYEVKAFDKLPVKFSLATEYIGIEDTIDLELPAHLIGLTSDIETTIPFLKFNNTYLRLGITPSFYGDDWDFEASNFRIPTRYFLIHRPNTRWTILAGVAVYPDYEFEVLPILGFIYKPNDKLTFNIIPKRPNISYLLNDRITLFAEGGRAFNKEFEVDRDNSKNVVLRYQESRLGGGIKFKFNKFIQSSLSIGGVFNRSLKYRDNQGKVNIKDGLYSEFRLEVAI